jgi:mono/diheme cytochrome c family protein
MTRSLTILLSVVALAKAGAVDFQKDVAPILETMCVKCHNPEKAKGELRMDTAEAFAIGGENGPPLEAGKPDESHLVKRVLLPSDDDEAMPPKGRRLKPEEIETLKGWIAEGGAFPEGITLNAREEGPAVADRNDPKDAEGLVSITFYPPAVNLETANDSQQVIVVAKYDDDTTRDVTAKVDFTVANPEFVTIEANQFKPKADGESKISVAFHGKNAEIPLKVVGADVERPISFKLDVMPVFMRSGCNTGSCHGAARGQDGFNLSLFGYDPDGDYFRLTREIGSRRLNLALPEESLMMQKAVEAVPHSGGKLFETDSAYYGKLMAWLKAGAPKDADDVATPVSMEIMPKQLLLEGEGATQQMIAVAKYSDGTDRDVTALAVFQSSNDPTAKISKEGLITAGARGEAFVMARFNTFTVGSQVIVIPDNLDYQKPEYPPNNYIDGLVADKVHRLRIIPSGLCSDEVFLRRASLDITGTIPTEEEYLAFTADSTPDKRAKLIDALLERKEFTELWVMKWAELLQIRTINNGNQMSYKATLLYYNWLQERIAKNTPFNLIVQELLSSSGGTFSNAATNYYQIERETLKVSENVAQVFMGMRIQCSQCHNHPFDRWTMNDYYSFAAFFSQVGRKTAEDPRETIVFNSNGGEVQHPVTKQNMKPKFLGGEVPEIKPGEDRRKVLAEWMASPQNPFFSRNLANIVWAHFFGAGIINPVDDVRVSNPASNPELLDALAQHFTDYNYDFKRLVRDICNSRTYQLTTQTNPTNSGDGLNFSHSLIRRMRAEVMLDAISTVTETKNKFKGLPLGARAVQIADGNVSNYFLETFGRATRGTVCSCEVKMEPNLGQALHLINGDNTGNRVRNGNVVKNLLDQGKTPQDIVDSLYIRTLGRKPTPAERDQLAAAATEDPMKVREGLEDVFWSLLNSKEFMFNH